MKINAYEKHNENVENLLCIGVDGRTDKDTLHYKESVEENGKKNSQKSQRTWMPLDNHKGYTKWEYIFDSQGFSWYWCYWYTIKAVLVDNTNANTGCEGWLVTLLEKKIKINLHTTSKWTSI